MAFDNRREYFRIPFPEYDRPRVVVGTVISEVIECSERGLSYHPAAEPGDLGEVLEGRIRFPRGVELPIRSVQDAHPDVKIVTDHLIGSAIKSTEITVDRCIAQLKQWLTQDQLRPEQIAILSPHRLERSSKLATKSPSALWRRATSS